jgi:His/Glu/Gln/Arg/opine family amino acid ABC transporter permease subunit
MTWVDLLTLAESSVVTVLFSLSGIAIGVPLGLALALVRWARIPAAARVVAIYVSFVRSAPIPTFVLFVFFVPPVLGLEIGPPTAAVLALSLNTAAFNCEIWRSALMNTPREHLEAGLAMGMTRGILFRRIVFPQIWRRSLAPLVNEMTVLVKGTPAIAVIGIAEITRTASRIGSETYEPLPPFLAAAALYTLIVLVFVRSQRLVEERLAIRYGMS